MNTAEKNALLDSIRESTRTLLLPHQRTIITPAADRFWQTRDIYTLRAVERGMRHATAEDERTARRRAYDDRPEHGQDNGR